jgi:hypothetical protein
LASSPDQAQLRISQATSSQVDAPGNYRCRKESIMKKKSVVPTPDFDQFFVREEAIHNYFGYEEDWVKIPLTDDRYYYWILDQKADGTGRVLYYDKPFTEEILDSGVWYSAMIYTQRFLPKWVYETPDHTLISMNPQTDGNRYLGVFDNTKRQKIEDFQNFDVTRKYE